MPSLSADASPAEVTAMVNRVIQVGGAMLAGAPPTSRASTNHDTVRSQVPTNHDTLRSVPSLRAIMITMGNHGFVIVRRSHPGKEDIPLLETPSPDAGVVGLHFPPPPLPKGSIVSVSGAGDCLASGFLMGVVKGDTVRACAAAANMAAACSLRSISTVPAELASLKDGDRPDTDFTVFRPSSVC